MFSCLWPKRMARCLFENCFAFLIIYDKTFSYLHKTIVEFLVGSGKKVSRGWNVWFISGKKSCLRLKISLNVKQILIFKVQKRSRMTKRSKCWQGHTGVFQGQKMDKEETIVLLIEEFHLREIFYLAGWKTFSHESW